MPGWVAIAIGIMIFGTAFKIVFPTESKKIGIMTKGHLNLFIRDRAQTPKGAEAIYTEAIEQAEDARNTADENVRVLTGRIEMAKQDMKTAKKDLAELERQCEALVKAGDYDNAEILAAKREVVLAQIQGFQDTIDETQPLLVDAETIYTASSKQVEILTIRKTQVVEGLKRSQEYNDMVDNLDELKKKTTISKLVASVDEGYKESQERLAGARASYNNRLDTKVNKAIATSKKTSSSAYIEQLKGKYNK